MIDLDNLIEFPKTPEADIIYETLNGKEYYWFFGKRRWKFNVEEEQKREYKENVIECLINEYNMNRRNAKAVFKALFKNKSTDFIQ